MLCQIIPKKCIACGLCQIKAPDFFDYYDNGIVKFIDSDRLEKQVSEPIDDNLMAAYLACPTRAIVLEK